MINGVFPMKRRSCILLLISAVSLAATLSACEADDSAPTRPRTANPLTPDAGAQDNAEKRVLEKPQPQMPTSGAEFPGQSKADFNPDPRVLTLQASPGGTATPASDAASAASAPVQAAAPSQAAATQMAPLPPVMPAAVPVALGQNGAPIAPMGITLSPDDISAPPGAPQTPASAGSNLPPTSPLVSSETLTNKSPLAVLGFSGPAKLHAFGHTTGPETTYTHTDFPGLLPILPANPGTTPMTGAMPTPSGDYMIGYDWGQDITLQNYPHRDWPKSMAYYASGGIYNNPVYFFQPDQYLNLPQQIPVPQIPGLQRLNLPQQISVPPEDGSVAGDWLSEFVDIPWFMVNTGALPVLMALEPPLAKRMTVRPGGEPNFLGYVPSGPAVAAPEPGVLEWSYTWLNPDWTVKEPEATNTYETTQPETQPETTPGPSPATMPGG